MNNNPDVSHVVLCAFRNADSDESELRTHKVLNGEKCKAKRVNLSYPLSFHPLPTCLTVCVLLEALLCWWYRNAQETIMPLEEFIRL